jgi:hypothetical protein
LTVSLGTISLDRRVIDLCCLYIICERKALDPVQEILDRLVALAKATYDDVLVETCSACAWPLATQPVEQVAIVHKIFACEVRLVHEWGSAVPSLEIEQSITFGGLCSGRTSNNKLTCLICQKLASKHEEALHVAQLAANYRGLNHRLQEAQSRKQNI